MAVWLLFNPTQRLQTDLEEKQTGLLLSLKQSARFCKINKDSFPVWEINVILIPEHLGMVNI